jgi:hypothetical protein
MKLRYLKAIGLATDVVVPIVAVNFSLFVLTLKHFIPIMKLLAKNGLVVNVRGLVFPFRACNSPNWKKQYPSASMAVLSKIILENPKA